MARQRKNFVTGTLGAQLTSVNSAVTFTTVPSGLATLASGDYYLLVMNPTPYNTPSASSEIVYMTAYTSGTLSGTLGVRGAEGTTATTWPSGTTYAHGVVASDFTLVNGISNGDFPTPTDSGQLFVSTASGASNPSWTKIVTNLQLSGFTSNWGTINGGDITYPTISGATIKNSVINSGNTFNAGSVPISALTSGIAGTVLVNSGSGASWGSAGLVSQDLTSTDVTLNANNVYPTGAGTLTLTLSGARCYSVTAITTAYNGTVATNAAYYKLKYSTNGGSSWTDLGLQSVATVATGTVTTLSVNYTLTTAPSTTVLFTAVGTSNRTTTNTNFNLANQTLTALGVK